MTWEMEMEMDLAMVIDDPDDQVDLAGWRGDGYGDGDDFGDGYGN